MQHLIFLFLLLINGNNNQKADQLITGDQPQYPSVIIGDQEWMTINWDVNMPKSWFYNNDSTLDKKYGKLYYYSNAMAAAPKGWHLPSMDEWWKLITYLGGPDSASFKMLEGGSSGLNLVAAGYKSANISPEELFGFIDHYAFYWTSTTDGDQTAYAIHLTKNKAEIELTSFRRANGFSVRYVKDK